jgi:NADH-quinone oxidoreductase subunit N
MRTVPVYGMVEGAEPKILNVLVVLGLVSMIYGNIVALQQTNVKRILAFSSVAHSGYVLLAMACGPEGYLAALFYLVVYALMTLGAFGMITLFENAGIGARLSEWQGKGRELVLPAVVMSVVLFSLAGLPPLGGFMGKYMVFGTAIRTAVQANNNLLLIAATAGIVTSVIGAFYYLRVIQVLFFQKPFSTRFGQENKVADHNLVSPSKIAVGAGLLIAALVILFGVYPSLLLEWLAVPYGADGHLTSYLSFLSR